MRGKKNSIDEVPLRSTPNDFDRFMGSTIWFDMQQTVKDRIEYLQHLLLEGSDTDINELIALKNQMKAWKEMLGLPSYLKQCSHKDTHANQEELNLE